MTDKKELAEQITPEKALSNLWRQKQSELIDKHIIPMYATLRAQSISYFLKDGTVSGSFRQALEDIMNDVRKFIAPQPAAAIIEAMGAKPEDDSNNADGSLKKAMLQLKGLYVSDKPQSVEAMGVQPGMRWVKASERLPDNIFKTHWREMLNKKPLEAQDVDYCLNKNPALKGQLEWLEETPQLFNNEQNVQVSDTRNDAQRYTAD